MEEAQFINELSSFIKTASIILGSLVIIIKLFHQMFDSHRTYRIKQLELLYNCMKEPESSISAYVVEKLFETTYKVHIPYRHVKIIIQRDNRFQLFSYYRQAIKYLSVVDGQFELKVNYATKGLQRKEKFMTQLKNTIKYYFSSFTSLMLLVVSYHFFFSKGVMEIQFYTYNVVWFGISIVFASLLGKVAINALSNPDDINVAVKFVNAFSVKEQANSNPRWLY